MSDFPVLFQVQHGIQSVYTTIIYDTFTDTDAKHLHDHTISPTNTPAATWSTFRNIHTIYSNNVRPNSNNEQNSSVDAGVANVRITCNVTIGETSGSNHNVAILCRVTDTDNYWRLSVRNNTDSFSLTERTAATSTVRATASPTVNINTGYKLVIVANGNSLIGTLDGANTLAYTSASHNTVTKHGLYTLSPATVVNWDTHNDFRVESIT